MSGKKDVSQLKDVVVLVAKIVESGIEIAKSGKIDVVADAGVLLKLIPAVGPAIEGASEIPAELEDLQADEVADLAAAVALELAIESEKAKQIIACSFKVLGAVIDLKNAITLPAAPVTADAGA